MITFTREEAQQILDALEDAVSCGEFIEVYKNIKEKLNEPILSGGGIGRHPEIPQPIKQESILPRGGGSSGEITIDGWPLYSGLPKREWVGLTEHEKAIWKEPAIAAVLWTEMVLKEKNNG
jgi:hypothetical protein